MVKKRNLLILLGLLVLLMTPGQSTAATINIDASKTVDINSLIYGNNMNVGAGWENTAATGWGVWDPCGTSAASSTSVQAVVDFAQEAGITILRFPGGCIAHEYHWLDGIGPYAGRPNSLYGGNPDNNFVGWDISDNKYGTDEHMAFSEDAGAEVMMTVNINGHWVGVDASKVWEVCTPNEAAAWVAYLNGSVDDPNQTLLYGRTVSEWAALRGNSEYANHPAPYNVKYWEVDNEVWHHTDNITYINEFQNFYKAMKAVDPDIKVGAVVAGRYTWQKTLIETLGGEVDFIIHHAYKPFVGQSSFSNDVNDVFRATLAAPAQVQGTYTSMRNIIEISPGSSARAQDIELFITEFNTTFEPSNHPNYQYSLGSALNIAEMLNYFIVPDNKIGAANIWEFKSNTFGQVKGLTAPDYIVRPTQDVFKMYNYYFGSELVNTTVTSDTYESIEFYDAQAVTKYTAGAGDAKLRIRLQREKRNPGTNISGDIWYDDLVIRESGSDDNLLTNPGFEDSPEFAGWTHSSTDPQGVTSSIDSTTSRSDSNSFRLSFDGSNDPSYDSNMYQDVDITFGTSYEIEGYIKTQGITPAPMNLLTDPGFENGGTNWVFNTVPGANTTIDINAAEAHNGSKSVKIEFDGSDVNYYHTLQTINNIDPNLVYMLEGYIKTTGLITDGSGVTLELSDNLGNSASTQYLPQIKGSTDGWVYISTNKLNPPYNATQLKVRLRRYGGSGKTIDGIARFDDLRVQAVPQYYAPNIEVDVLDSGNNVKETITLSGILGTHDWLKKTPAVTHSGTPYLSAVASKDASGNLYLMVINKNLDTATGDITATINISGYSPLSDASVWTLNGPSIDSTNETSNLVGITSSSIIDANSSFDYTFPAHSLTAIVFGGSAPSTPEPVAFWKMDEASWNGTAGEVIDSSTGGLDNSGKATATGTASLPNTTTDPTRGQVGSFPGGDATNGAGLVWIAGNSSQDISYDLTIAGWINMDIAGNNHILSKASNQTYKLHMSNGQIKLTLWNTAGAQQPYADPDTLTTPIPAGEWHHIAAVADFDTSAPNGYGYVYFYLDGSPSGTVDLTQSQIQTNTWGISIGAATSDGHGAFDGLLDEVRLYNVALTAAQIAEIAGVGGGDTTPPANPTNLAATAGDGQVSLNWDDNTEGDLDGYNVYRSQTSGSGYTKINASLVSTSDYVDSTVTNSTTYYYVVTAVDTSSNESGYSNEVNATPTGAGLVGHWTLDDGTGSTTAADSSGNGYTGTLNGNPVWTTGRVGDYALDFDGAGDYVGITGYNGITGGNSRTVAVWIKTAVAPQWNDLVSWGSDATVGTRWQFTVNYGYLFLGVSGGFNKGNIDVSDGQWHHVAAVLEDDGSPTVKEVKLYVDGVLNTNSGTSTQAINTDATANVKIGSYQNYFDGLIDEVRLYNVALTSGEITQLSDIPPKAASSPNPSNGAPDVSTTTDLSWTAGAGATGHDVYFGTSPTPPKVSSNQPGITYDPGTLANDTTYYWRIDELNAYGTTTTGDAWSFTTEAAQQWTQLTYDGFESGWGNYTDGGGDASRYTGGTYAHQGNAAIDIQDNSGVASSFYYTNGIDVDTPGYTQIEVDFWFYPKSMESGEDFWVQYYDGSSWNTVASYARGTDFNNDQFYHKIVYINEASYTFPTNMKIRFRCDASSNWDDVYIDEVKVSAK